jgi:hypothetical protein
MSACATETTAIFMKTLTCQASLCLVMLAIQKHSLCKEWSGSVAPILCKQNKGRPKLLKYATR